jgi:cell division septation protein DedD
MRLFFLSLFVAVCPLTLLGQSSPKQTPLPPHPNAPASQEVETEKIGPPGQTPAPPSAQATTGYMEPEQVKALMHKMWLAQFRLNDLLTQVHPEKWKMPAAVGQSFGQSMESLHQALEVEEAWRSQFEARPDSLYLGFQTYVAISAVLPRVDGVAHSVSLYENASLGAQYSQAANQLFDLQQSIEPHLAYLLKNQDGLLLASQTNLASCQNELNFAEHNKEGRATPMKNIAPEFKGRKRTAQATTPAAASGTKPAEAKGKAAAKPAKNPPNKTPQK